MLKKQSKKKYRYEIDNEEIIDFRSINIIMDNREVNYGNHWKSLLSDDIS